MIVIGLSRHRVDGHDDGADFRRAEKRRDKLGRIRQYDQDARARRQFFSRERRGHAIR